MDSFNRLSQGLILLGVLAFWPFSPGEITTFAHLEHPTHQFNGELTTVLKDEAVN